MRKALHIINGDLYAGAERVQDLLALNLPRYGYEIGLVTLKDGMYARARRARNVPLYSSTMRNRFDLRVAPRIASIARTGGYGIMHTHSPRGLLVGTVAASLAGLPLLHHLHGPTTSDTEHTLRNHWNSLVERICIRKARHVIAVSRSVAGYARSLGVRPDSNTVVQNGVETASARPVTNGQGELTLGAVALFRPRKGVEVLIAAVAQLAEMRSERFKLVMVGDFETEAYEDKIKSLARRLKIDDRIQWTGFTRDVAQMLRQMDVFVLPSLYGEGMPMVVLEAMALGVPIVATAVGGVVETIEDRRHGLLVRPGDASALCTALNTLIDDQILRMEIGNAARRRQTESFSADSMAGGVAAVYDKILDAG